MIIWLDDPLKYPYLRRAKYMFVSHFPVKRMTKRLSHFVGYERICKATLSWHFMYNVYYTRKGDRDNDPSGVYAGPPEYGGKMPTEAVNPLELVKITPYQGDNP